MSYENASMANKIRMSRSLRDLVNIDDRSDTESEGDDMLRQDIVEEAEDDDQL